MCRKQGSSSCFTNRIHFPTAASCTLRSNLLRWKYWALVAVVAASAAAHAASSVPLTSARGPSRAVNSTFVRPQDLFAAVLSNRDYAIPEGELLHLIGEEGDHSSTGDSGRGRAFRGRREDGRDSSNGSSDIDGNGGSRGSRNNSRTISDTAASLSSYAPKVVRLIPSPPGNVHMATPNGVSHSSPSNSSRYTFTSSYPSPYIPSIPIDCVSVVLVAHNEHAYVQRTLDSIVAATSPAVLSEIIVIDDASSPPLSTAYDTDQYHLPLVKLVVNTERQGLIRCKIEGAEGAKPNNIIVFLDCHVRPDPGWLYPIIRHINSNYKRVVVPKIPVLDGTTWQVNRKAVGIKMMFDWDFNFHWFEDHNDWVPVMSGGLLAIGRRWWDESGELDKGMLMWGSENIEQSIRVWLCGGEIVVARDSVVAHVFRAKFPYKLDNVKFMINKVRTAEGWLDNYKQNFFDADKAAKKYISSVGNMDDRMAIKERLHCKPFQWFVDRFKDVFMDRGMVPRGTFSIQYVPLPSASSASSSSPSTASDSRPRLCMTTANAAAQLAMFLRHRLNDAEVTPELGRLLAFRGSGAKNRLSLAPCDESDANQRFAYRFNSTALYHIKSNMCVDAASPPTHTPATNAYYKQKKWQTQVTGVPKEPPRKHEVLLFTCEKGNGNQDFERVKQSGRIAFASYCLDAADVERGGYGETLKLGVCTRAVKRKGSKSEETIKEETEGSGGTVEAGERELGSMEQTADEGGQVPRGVEGRLRMEFEDIQEIAPYQTFVFGDRKEIINKLAH